MIFRFLNMVTFWTAWRINPGTAWKMRIYWKVYLSQKIYRFHCINRSYLEISEVPPLNFRFCIPPHLKGAKSESPLCKINQNILSFSIGKGPDGPLLVEGTSCWRYIRLDDETSWNWCERLEDGTWGRCVWLDDGAPWDWWVPKGTPTTKVCRNKK